MILDSDPEILNGREKEWRKRRRGSHLDNEYILSPDELKNEKETHFEE